MPRNSDMFEMLIFNEWTLNVRKNHDYLSLKTLYKFREINMSGEQRNEQDEKRERNEIIVNGKPHNWDKKEISYSEVVDLAFPPPQKETEIFTVQYSRGPNENREGTLVQGQQVFVKNGMNFHVSRTDKS